MCGVNKTCQQMYFAQEPLYASHNTKGADVMTLDQPIEGTNVTGGAFERSCGKSGKLWYFVAAFISFLIPSQFLMRFIFAVYHFWNVSCFNETPVREV